MIRSALSIFHGRIQNSGVEVRERLRADGPIRCFEGEIRQVVSNLISNALDAMRAGAGVLSLRTRVGTNWKNGAKGIVITIADDGVGMNAETRAKLFDPFFTTKGLTGTGLGLWVSKEIVDRHHGLLRVRSSQSPEHRGTVVNLFLPFESVVR